MYQNLQCEIYVVGFFSLQLLCVFMYPKTQNHIVCYELVQYFVVCIFCLERMSIV